MRHFHGWQCLLHLSIGSWVVLTSLTLSGVPHLRPLTAIGKRCCYVQYRYDFNADECASIAHCSQHDCLRKVHLPPLSASLVLRAEVACSDLGKYFHDLNRWRERSPRAQNCDFRLLDMRNQAGWELARKLICRRNDFLRSISSHCPFLNAVCVIRGRLSADEALGQRYFSS